MNYWERRQAEDAYEAFEDAEKTAKVIARYYAGASSFLIRKAERVFEKFRQKHHLTEAEAKALLSRVRDKKSAAELLERLRASVNRQEKAELLSEIEAPAYRARLMRLAELQDNTDRVMQALYTKENDTSTEFYRHLAEESYLKEIYRTQQRANAAFSFGSFDKKTVDRVLRSKWSGKNYSERIWDNTQELADTLKDEMILSFLTGKGERDMAQSIQNRFQVGANAARRLVRTESNHIRTEMDFEAYKEAGVEEYQYLATLDLRTSKICRSLDGKIFKVSERKTGENCPPMHPWCRSTTISVIDRELLDTMQRAAIDPKTGERIMVPRTMTYEEWHDKYVKDFKPIDAYKTSSAGNQSIAPSVGMRRTAIGKGSRGIKESYRAKTAKTEEDLRKISKSPVIFMDSLDEIVLYFDSKYGIEIQDFQGQDLFQTKATLAGYDDFFTEFPEAGELTRNIMFSPIFEDDGKMSSAGFSVVGPSGLAYGTGLHEAAHALDYAKSSPELHTFSNVVLIQAIREAGYKTFQENIHKIIGSLFLTKAQIANILADPSELFAYSLETALAGGNAFADILLEVTKRYYAEFV